MTLLYSSHARKDSVALGKFSLGLTGCPSGIFTQKIYGLVNAVTSKVGGTQSAVYSRVSLFCLELLPVSNSRKFEFVSISPQERLRSELS